MKNQITKINAAFAVLLLLIGCEAALPFEIRLKEEASVNSDFAAPQGYSRAFSPAAHNFRRATGSVGEPVRLGRVSERYELRHGDCDAGDCSTPRARAEIQMSQEINDARIGKDIWYGWSFYNETVPAFTNENSLRLVFGQWTMGGGERSIIRLIQLGKGESNFDACDPRVCFKSDTAKGDVVVQLDDMATFHNWGAPRNDGYICRLFDMNEQKGKWVDITMNTNFSNGIDGYLRIWVNGKLACDYSGPLVSAASVMADRGRTPEHRRGIFSTWDKRWLASMGDALKPTLVVYYDEFRSGALRSDVDVPIRIANSAPPLD